MLGCGRHTCRGCYQDEMLRFFSDAFDAFSPAHPAASKSNEKSVFSPCLQDRGIAVSP